MSGDEKQQQRMREELDRRADEERQRAHEERAMAEAEQVEKPERQADDLSPRAKSSRHGKVTADKWNQ